MIGRVANKARSMVSQVKCLLNDHHMVVRYQAGGCKYAECSRANCDYRAVYEVLANPGGAGIVEGCRWVQSGVLNLQKFYLIYQLPVFIPSENDYIDSGNTVTLDNAGGFDT